MGTYNIIKFKRRGKLLFNGIVVMKGNGLNEKAKNIGINETHVCLEREIDREVPS